MGVTKNSVYLIDKMGSDKTVCLSAWQSTTEELGIELPPVGERVDAIFEAIVKTKKKSPEELIKMLADAKHETPFEKIVFHFQVTSDIASHIHVLKHRIASVNSECLEKNTLISFENNTGRIGRRLTISDLYEKWTNGRPHQPTEKDKVYVQERIKNMRLRVLDESTGKFTTSRIKDIWKTAKKQIYKITLRNGKFILCSENHPLYTKQGYKSIAQGLGIGDLVGCNGVVLDDIKRPWTFKEFFDTAVNFTRLEFSNKVGLGYNLVKKWGYIHNINFKPDTNKDFKKGMIPWNKDKKGYKIDIKDRKHNPKRGKDSHFWRGGVTSERVTVGVWTTRQARKVHTKYNFTCQRCQYHTGGRMLHAHHIIPVTQDLSKAFDFDNLITLCDKCHMEVHSSMEAEQEFALEVTKQKQSFSYDKRLNRKVNTAHQLYYSDVVSIEFVKEEECYDIEVEGLHKNFIANGIVTHNSARYKEFINDRFYIPQDWNVAFIPKEARDDLKQAGLNVDFCETWGDLLSQETERNYKLYHTALKYLPFSRKRKKESARYFLGYNTSLSYDFMINARSFINFQNLRNDDHAQDEIRWISQDMLQCIADYPGNPFKYTLEAFKLLDKLPKKESYVLENSEVFTFKVTRAVPWTDIHGNVREALP